MWGVSDDGWDRVNLPPLHVPKLYITATTANIHFILKNDIILIPVGILEYVTETLIKYILYYIPKIYNAHVPLAP